MLKLANESASSKNKKEIISPTESSEDVLDLYKRIDNTLEEIKASGRPLISK
ncbi:12562_t:CDS:2 [Funneliformis geosporum]|uniref:16516_t:CDS:1 n=1 Tax=Funneliformis geosporum TaxID=1117311 RepID=A0A9W4SY63_9GLOM|nr:16516_t:CDS:2 [Funneliformis geosporum]CAI2190144.1 12562_t:CDS:2 [Funneliformis geosporum]